MNHDNMHLNNSDFEKLKKDKFVLKQDLRQGTFAVRTLCQ